MTSERDRDLPADIEELLDAERTIDATLAPRRERIQDGLAHAGMLAGVGPSVPGLGSGSKAAGALTKMSLAAKVVSGIGGAALIATGGHALRGEASSPDAADGMASFSEVLPSPSPIVPTPPPAATPSASLLAPRHATAAVRPDRAPSSNDPRLARERQLLGAARDAMARGDSPKALAAIASHETEFLDGRLREEREALRVRALRAAGRNAESERARDAFVERYPESVLRDRVE